MDDPDFIGPPVPIEIIIGDRLSVIFAEAFYKMVNHGQVTLLARYSNKQIMLGQALQEAIMDESYNVPAVDYTYERPALPRPSKARLKINQARRQSFRQSMRSVNRNR